MFSSWIFGAALPTWAIFLELFFVGGLVIFAGSRLTRLADTISDRLNLGKAWIGMLLLATVTSLPELVTGGTAVIIDQPDLAFGNIFGSCMFNVAIIVLLNGLLRGGSILQDVNQAHTLSSTLGIIIMAMGVLGFLLVERMVAAGFENFEAIYCVVLAVTYLACMRLNYRYELKHQDSAQMALVPLAPHNPVVLYATFGFMSFLLIVLTVWLTQTGDVLQDHPLELLGGRTLGATFVGAFFLAVATSLPEIVTSLTAVRLGHLDLALGNIFGSNMFNVFVIPILKVFSWLRGQPALMFGEGVSSVAHTMTGLFAILLTGVAVASLLYRTKRRLWGFGFDSILIGLIYILGMYVVLKT